MATPPEDRTRTGRAGYQAADVGARPAIDGPLLRQLFVDAGALLQRHVQPINAINVYPVPDGDTGTNMHLTLRAALDELERRPAGDVAAVASALAEGALMGARGNSGVILSQILRGFGSALRGHVEADAEALGEALASASRAAYAALSEPVEGTILTVVRDAAEAVASEKPESAEDVLACAVTAAKRSVERSPELLPVLREAGVVDAGALGFAIVLEGMLRSLRGDPLDVDLAPQTTVASDWRSGAASLHDGAGGESGYCTEFVVSGQGLDLKTVRTQLESLGSSVLVVGGDGLIRVHLHTDRPDDALAYGRTLGELSQPKVDNLEAQIRRFVAAEPTRPTVATSIGVVAVAAGAGIADAFRSIGATQIVEGGQTMNPSAGEILAAIEACEQQDVLVLPNNKNIIAAARQSAERTTKRVAVIPSRTVPQGIAAMLALSDLPFEANEEAMARALSSVRSAEVTRAVRATTIDGQRVEQGQAIGIIDGSLQVISGDIAEAAKACIAKMASPEATLLTIYAGKDVREEDARLLAQALREREPDLEVELVAGGQPHYPYILSLE